MSSRSFDSRCRLFYAAPMTDRARERRPLVAVLLVAALLAYSVLALGVERWWISGLAAPVVAALLWARHRRARFSAYVFLTVVVLRGLAVHAWWAMALGGAGILLLQTSAAQATWPRLRSSRPSAPPSPAPADDGGKICRP